MGMAEDFKVLVNGRLDMTQLWHSSPESQTCAGLHPEQCGQQGREGILPLCSAETPPAVLHPALGSQHGKMEMLEQVQRRDSRLIRGLELLFCQYESERTGSGQPAKEEALE